MEEALRHAFILSPLHAALIFSSGHERLRSSSLSLSTYVSTGILGVNGHCIAQLLAHSARFVTEFLLVIRLLLGPFDSVVM